MDLLNQLVQYAQRISIMLLNTNKKKAYIWIGFIFLFQPLHAQICGTPGLDGPANISSSINTYFPMLGDVVLSAGAKSINLGAVPPDDLYGNNFGLKVVNAGDLLLIIQMQDATINYTNDILYGSNNSTSGPDLLGATGYTNIGNSGKFEYVIATNAVPLSGGILTFKGLGAANGAVNTYINAAATATRGARTFQIVRVPQYSNLTLTKDIKTPPFNGKAGGIIAFDVAGTMNFNGFLVDASARGFRGGYGPVDNSGNNINNIYVIPSSDSRSTGKGEGIAGTPRYMWDGFNKVDNLLEGLPGGSYGRGAPANAGGGGNDHNSGGGGGGNGGAGGVGGNGVTVNPVLDTYPNGGRPGSNIYDAVSPDISRLIMGGGGGGGDANNALDGVRGGVGGGIILINAGRITGAGKIISNGGDGDIGLYGTDPDGAGGGGAGGTVFIKVNNPDLTAMLTIEAKGGNGGNTKGDQVNNHGPGGGGGGGQVFYAMPSTTINVNVLKGLAGISATNSNHFSADGRNGNIVSFTLADLPSYLQGTGSGCYPQLTTRISESNAGVSKYAGSEVIYVVKATNATGGGNAGGVRIDAQLPTGFSYASATVSYTGNSGGPVTLSNLTKDNNRPLFGDFNISPGDDVIITLIAKVDCSVVPATYQASVQSIYFDPSRTLNDPERRITPFTNAFPGSKTTYETGSGGVVAGSNYNGNLPGSTAEDVTMLPVIISNNRINAPAITTFCILGDPQPIIGELPIGGDGNFSYQWQQSTDNVTFTAIAGATAKDYDPPQLNDSTYYRRIVLHLGCVQPDLSNIILLRVIKPLPAVDFDTPDICLRDGQANFINKTTISDGDLSRLSYLWDFGDSQANAGNPNTAVSRNASHIYTQTGNYTITLTVIKDGGCPQISQKVFRVNGSVPKAAFNVQNTSFCSGVEMVFEDKATVDFGEITKIEWYYDYINNPTVAEVDNQPEKRNTTARLYKHTYPVFHTPASNPIIVRMVVYSGISCVDELTMPITLKAVPEVSFDAIPSVCNDAAPYQLTQAKEIWGILSGTGQYSGTGVSANGTFNPRAAGPGTHTLTYTFSADNGCSDIKTQTITVLSSPTVDAGRDQSILEGGEVQLMATATGNNLTYKWTPSAGLSRDDILQPIATPGQDITYKLTVTSDQGCIAIDDVFVQVLQNPEIPNTFTPNGDGINDEWNIKYLSSYPLATINVYNRYGEKVFSSTTSIKSWDGKHQGKDMPVGTYYYVINPHNGRKTISGTVTILR